MNFEFATATRIVFGDGAVSRLGALASEMGRRALLVTGAGGRGAAGIVEDLRASGVETVRFAVSGEPTTDVVSQGVELARSESCDMAIALGGGSAIDAGKAIAALLTNNGDLFDYLEVIGQGRAIERASAPFIAAPTTAGTGAEVTRNAVLGATEQRVKVSMRSPLMLPRLALVDPELTRSMSPELTAAGGLDALTQLLEAFVSDKANPMTDALCREGLGRAARSLRRACEAPDDSQARSDMALASLFSGLALANAKLGAVHGFAGPLGGMYPGAPHGAICGRLLPGVMRANVRALRERAPDSPVLGRFDEAARLLVGDADASAEDGAAWIESLCAALPQMPSLEEFGLRPEHFGEVADKAREASSMKGNPIALTREELIDILAT